MNVTKVAIILLHAFIGWALCAATIGIGMSITSLDTALVVHAIAAPVFFTLVSLVYFHRFDYTTPLMTAIIFTAFVIGMDLFVVALLVNRSLEMFTSLIDTWIPFILIFLSTLVTGIVITRKA